MRRLLSILLALGLVLSFSLVTAVPVLGADLYVPSPSYPTISSALLDAVSGDTIYVAAGTYTENITLKNGVNVMGAGAADTTIDGSGDSDSVVVAPGISSGTVFDGFTVTNGEAGVGGGMYLNNSSLTVTNCIFTGNLASLNGGGMYILNDSSPTVANCIFEDNTVEGPSASHGGGIYCWSSGSPTIINNTIANNEANVNGGGIYTATTSPTITNNIIVGNTAAAGGGIYCFTASLPTSFNNVFANSLEQYVNCIPSNSISEDPDFDADYHLSEISPCIDVGDNTAVATAGLTTDFDGEPRVFDGDDNGTATVDMGADEYYVPPPPPPPSGAVGGTVYPVDKAAILLPWLGLGLVLILAAGGLLLVRRRSQ